MAEECLFLAGVPMERRPANANAPNVVRLPSNPVERERLAQKRAKE